MFPYFESSTQKPLALRRQPGSCSSQTLGVPWSVLGIELSFEGAWQTWGGLLDFRQKVEAIKNIMPPTTQKILCQFIISMNYYCDTWEKRSHFLHHLTGSMFSKVKFKWKDIEQKALDEIKRIVARNNLSVYPYLNQKLTYIYMIETSK